MNYAPHFHIPAKGGKVNVYKSDSALRFRNWFQYYKYCVSQKKKMKISYRIMHRYSFPPKKQSNNDLASLVSKIL